jgi:hypothetical protein
VKQLSLANIQFTLKQLIFSHRPAKFSFMIKTLLKLILSIFLGSKKDYDLTLENFAPHQQPATMRRSAKRPRLRTRDRLFWVLLSRFWTIWQEALIIVKPETVVRWHRKGFKLFWRRKPRTNKSATTGWVKG